MKKLLILFILFSLLLSGCGLYNLNNFVLPDDTKFLALIQELDTPEKIGKYMLKNFKTELHSGIPLTPHQLYLSQKGDCDDFSTFFIFIANYHGYETYQIRILFATYVYGYPVYHLIPIFKENNCYTFSENQYYNPYGQYYNSFKNIMQIYHGWVSYSVYDYDNNLIEQATK